MDTNTGHYKAAITLSNLTMYDLTPLSWHISARADNMLEGQVPHGHTDVLSVIEEWANVLGGNISEYPVDDDITSIHLDANYGDYGTFIKIWGHIDARTTR